jgi:lycopene cyclase domain-containing protein
VPEYTLASLLFLAGGLVAAAARGMLRERAAWLGLVAFGAITVVADTALTGLPIVTYGRQFNAGIYVGPMPIEDLLYGLALYLVAIAAWGRRPARPTAGPDTATRLPTPAGPGPAR